MYTFPKLLLAVRVLTVWWRGRCWYTGSGTWSLKPASVKTSSGFLNRDLQKQTVKLIRSQTHIKQNTYSLRQQWESEQRCAILSDAKQDNKFFIKVNDFEGGAPGGQPASHQESPGDPQNLPQHPGCPWSLPMPLSPLHTWRCRRRGHSRAHLSPS